MKPLTKEAQIEMVAMDEVLRKFGESLSPDEWLEVICRRFMEIGGHDDGPCENEANCPLNKPGLQSALRAIPAALRSLTPLDALLVLGAVIGGLAQNIAAMIERDERLDRVEKRNREWRGSLN